MCACPVIRAAARMRDLADGRGAEFFFFGGNFDYDFDNGWSISDKFLFDDGDADTNALFSGNNPATLNDMLYDATDRRWLASCRPARCHGQLRRRRRGPLDQSVIQQGWWHIHKHLKSFNNDFRLSKELFEGNTLTAGLYINHYTMDDKWSLGNQMLMTNTPNATPITVSYVDADGNVHQRTDPQGFARLRRLPHRPARQRHQHGVLPVRFLAHRQVAAGPVRARREPGRDQQRLQSHQPVDLDGNPPTDLRQRGAGVQRHVRQDRLRQDPSGLDRRRQLFVHRPHVDVRPRQHRRPLPRLRQRHPRQHHRQHAADAEDPQLRNRLQVPVRPAVCGHQRLSPRVHAACSTSRPTAPARRWAAR